MGYSAYDWNMIVFKGAKLPRRGVGGEVNTVEVDDVGVLGCTGHNINLTTLLLLIIKQSQSWTLNSISILCSSANGYISILVACVNIFNIPFSNTANFSIFVAAHINNLPVFLTHIDDRKIPGKLGLFSLKRRLGIEGLLSGDFREYDSLSPPLIYGREKDKNQMKADR